MRRQNPFALTRGEYGVGIVTGENGTFIMTTKGVYQLHAQGHVTNGKWVNTSTFRPIEIERPQIRKVKS